jgi:hypothetical protein
VTFFLTILDAYLNGRCVHSGHSVRSEHLMAVSCKKGQHNNRVGHNSQFSIRMLKSELEKSLSLSGCPSIVTHSREGMRGSSALRRLKTRVAAERFSLLHGRELRAARWNKATNKQK